MSRGQNDNTSNIRRARAFERARLNMPPVGHDQGVRVAIRGPKVRGKRTIRIGYTESYRGAAPDPHTSIKARILNSLDPMRAYPKKSTCVVYDAAGNLIATIDPVTRERKPV